MTRTKIAIACQGGGSQTAFTAGAAKALVEHQETGTEFKPVAISAHLVAQYARAWCDMRFRNRRRHVGNG
jgi:predicted patatin/cPLA2 family phospholipase